MALNLEERYRSGHNGAASKADGRKPRGFESRPLRIFGEGYVAYARRELAKTASFPLEKPTLKEIDPGFDRIIAGSI